VVTLTAEADYGLSGQYIAQITGRDKKYVFSREFVGRKCGRRNETTEARVDDAGLYEVCNATRHGKNSRFVVLAEVGGELRVIKITREQAMKIAKALDDGQDFADLVRDLATAP
jgi:hypothetical protein